MYFSDENNRARELSYDKARNMLVSYELGIEIPITNQFIGYRHNGASDFCFISLLDGIEKDPIHQTYRSVRGKSLPELGLIDAQSLYDNNNWCRFYYL